MAGIAITVETGELGALDERFRRAVDRLGDTLPLMEEIGSYLESSIIDRFEREAGPNREPWAATIRGGAILQDTGRLRGSITSRASADEVEVGTNVIYGPTHQFGATIVPKQAKKLRFMIGGRVVFADKVEIPARPFLGIDGEDEAAIGDIVRDYVRDIFEDAR